jgi:hypothetical protein
MAEDLPTHLRGYVVACQECEDPALFHSLFYDVAERFAESHEDARGHTTDVTERKADA